MYVTEGLVLRNRFILCNCSCFLQMCLLILLYFQKLLIPGGNHHPGILYWVASEIIYLSIVVLLKIVTWNILGCNNVANEKNPHISETKKKWVFSSFLSEIHRRAMP